MSARLARLPLETRLFVALLVAILIITLPLYSLVLVQARNYTEAQLRTSLTQHLALAARSPGYARHRLADAADATRSWGVLVDRGGQAWFTDGVPHAPPPASALARARQGLPAEYRAGQTLVQLRAVPGGVIGLAGDLESITTFILRLCRINLSIAAALVLVASLTGGVLLRLGLQPLRGITRQARRLSAAHLSERLPVPATHDEVRALAESLNGMLDRLDGSFAALRAEESRTRAFAADASHELRTPLAALNGYLEVLARAPEDTQVRLELLMAARRESERAGRLVEDLLTLTRLDSGEALRPEPLEVRAWLTAFADRVRPVLPQHDLRVSVRGLQQVWAHADALRLEQALWNLLRNAARHAPPGTVIHVHAAQELDAVAFTVEDEGPGFTVEGLQRGFERFYRAHRDAHGAGLGLAIVRSIAEAHGGLARLGNRASGGAFVRFTAAAYPRALR
ncbi:HAMP domain-containing sensor histidine kinase [Deinococcus maricopensis]|uniref:histidine kinase n=1 Tax=Deinococcus maricopensis (strain DSM 21211 / LMG 22137 / NRRL B-23946 / LB-34) TaxID=709986 RepID=E8U383_DEIML|nr:ATP-binding protein [Deinococcus maricopensis]ADV66028.1 integral membrane sensor signal transduction histidine kinase [Deinococcus maricopensis DSM 21211]